MVRGRFVWAVGSGLWLELLEPLPGVVMAFWWMDLGSGWELAAECRIGVA